VLDVESGDELEVQDGKFQLSLAPWGERFGHTNDAEPSSVPCWREES